MKEEKNLKLDTEEKEILAAIEREEYVSRKPTKAELNRWSKAAQNTLEKKKSISIRISMRDLVRLKQKAAEEGMPYQTLISSTLHKFVTRNEKSQ